MSENTGILGLQVPITAKSADTLSNDTQKLVYVHIPKDKTPDISHVKILPSKTNTGSAGSSSFIPLSAKINRTTIPISSGIKKESQLSNSYTVTKTAKLSSGTNITFTPRPGINPLVNKPRPPILGNKLTLSPAVATSSSINLSPNTKSIKVSLNNNRNSFGATPTSVFKNCTTLNPPNVVVTQAPNRRPSIIPPNPLKAPKSVILQSKILSGARVTSPKVLPFSRNLATKQSSSSKTVLSYGTLFPSGVNANCSELPTGIKRDVFGTPKKEGGNYNSFTPPPLILQSGGNAKKLGNKKSGPTTISFLTGKSQNPGGGFNIYPFSRSNNLNKPNMVNFKISNGQIQQENAVRFDGIICDTRPTVLMSPPVPTANTSRSPLREEEAGNDMPETTTFRRVPSALPNMQSEQKDILQEAMSAMVSDMADDHNQSSDAGTSFTKYNDDSRSSLIPQNSHLPETGLGMDSKKSNPTTPTKGSQQALHDPIGLPIILSKPSLGQVGSPAPMLLQGTMAVPGANPLSVPVSIQGLLKMQQSPSVITTQGPTKAAQDVKGLIIRTDSVTVRRRGKDEEKRETSSKPDLSIIPILRNSSLENRSSSSASSALGRIHRMNFLDPAESPSKDDFNNKENSESGNVSKSDISSQESNNGASSDTFSCLTQCPTTPEGEGTTADDTEVKELLKWENGTGSLIGSDLRFKVNEFDAVELVEDKALDELKSKLTTLPVDTECRDKKECDIILPTTASSISEQPHTASSGESPLGTPQKNLPPTIHIHHARKPNLSVKKDEEMTESRVNADVGSRNAKNPYDICCCKNCGCYGLSSEFFRLKDNSFCTIACSEDYAVKEAEWNKEKLRLEKTKSRLKKTKSSEKEGIEKVEIKEIKAKEVNEQEIIAPTLPEVLDESLQLKDEKPPTPEVLKFQHPWNDSKTNCFSWTKYLEYCAKTKPTSRAAPLKLWNEPFPLGKNLFKTGMKLEGIDPHHQSLFCVMTVADVCGHRIRLHFDGYSDMYDFWCHANSPNIFQVGWCEKNGRKLETPPGIFNFTWKAYLEHCKAISAPRLAFMTRNWTTVTPPNSFRIGMKLEAEDRKNGWTCVGTVVDVLDNRILVHFDGWEKAFDTWFDITSPFIHPIGWCIKNDVFLYPPKDYASPDSFNWHEYLQETNSMGVPARALRARTPRDLKEDMKLEAIDKRNPMLIRVATVAAVKEYRILLHFDGWPDMYDYWVDDDTPDIHPPTWCSKTGHPLQPPLTPEECAEDVDSGVGCGTQGCKGHGHVKGLIYNTHHTAYGCPYSLQNLNKDTECLLPDRLDPPSKEKRKTKAVKTYINLDASKPIPEDDNEDAQKKRVRKRRKFFDELSPPEGSKTKMPRSSSDDFGAKSSTSSSSQVTSKGPPSSLLQGLPSSSSLGPLAPPVPSTSDFPKKVLGLSEEVSVDTMVHQSIFNPGYHPNPPPPLPHTMERHKHIISAIKLAQRCELDTWGPNEVREAVAKIPGCDGSADKLLHQDVDGESLLMLTQNDLVDLLGIKLGPAIKIMGMILNFKNMP